MFKKTFAALALGTALLSAGQAMAAEYKIDKEGQHAFVDWKISHLAIASSTAPSRTSTVTSPGIAPSRKTARSTSN